MSPADESFEKVVADAERSWPGVRVPRDDFRAFVDARLKGALADAAYEELYLTCACARRDPKALELFEQHYMAELDGVLERFGAAIADEAKQLTRLKLFGPDTAIAEFRGQGDLRNWLKVVAVRMALAQARAQKHAEPVGDELEAELVHDSELELFRRKYGRELKLALEEAVQTLELRERNVLRQHLVDRLNIDELGALYRVNRVTAYRWVCAAKEKLVALTRERLSKKLALEPAELNSLLRVVGSQLDLSLVRVLKPPA